jgi:hypothetical protein
MVAARKRRYGWWINGEPVRNRYGQPRKDDSWGIKLPVCEECNRVLNQKFEQPAKPHIRKLMALNGDVAFGGADAMKVARWFLKTWLLWAHPTTRESVPGIAPSRWDGVADNLYTWMVTDQLPPAGLSMWVTKRGEDEPGDSPTRHIPLPRVVADGREIEFRVAAQVLMRLGADLSRVRQRVIELLSGAAGS